MAAKRARYKTYVYYSYQLLVGLVFWTLFPVLLLVILITGKHRQGLFQRLGVQRIPRRLSKPGPRLWVHAASIGEIQVAGVLIEYLTKAWPDVSIVVSTMTLQGRDFARTRFTDVDCFLAPLDVPLVVDWVLFRVDPDVYICLETELWPLLIQKINRSGRGSVLLNGRISDRSVASYQRLTAVFQPVIASFNVIGAISEKDGERFFSLGAQRLKIEVTGNLKYDPLLKNPGAGTSRNWRASLGIAEGAPVVVAGSTHDPEEQVLLETIARCNRQATTALWLIAPRHLDRLPEIKRLFARHSISFQLLSQCLQTGRKERLIVVDTLGDLGQLYSVATVAFIGGSLCNYGGHNMFEAAVWQVPVLFGPHTQNFQVEAEALVAAGGAVRVAGSRELCSALQLLVNDQGAYQRAAQAAGAVVARQRGAGKHQLELVRRVLNEQFPPGSLY